MIAHPEDAAFRTVRLLNAAFQQSVARHAGGVEALLAMGFVEKESLDDEGALFLLMEEPNLELDYDGWGRWYDGVKASRDALLGRMESLGVRPVPPASKGTGWSEATAQPQPVRAAEVVGGLTYTVRGVEAFDRDDRAGRPDARILSWTEGQTRTSDVARALRSGHSRRTSAGPFASLLHVLVRELWVSNCSLQMYIDSSQRTQTERDTRTRPPSP